MSFLNVLSSVKLVLVTVGMPAEPVTVLVDAVIVVAEAEEGMKSKASARGRAERNMMAF
jgi:hypothetical protein